MRSYFFSADTQEDMLGWVRALSQSATMEPNSTMNRRCSSYQDFTQIGGSSETDDFPKSASEDGSPSQERRHVSRTLSEPSHLSGGRMGRSQSEHRGRRSVHHRNRSPSNRTPSPADLRRRATAPRKEEDSLPEEEMPQTDTVGAGSLSSRGQLGSRPHTPVGRVDIRPLDDPAAMQQTLYYAPASPKLEFKSAPTTPVTERWQSLSKANPNPDPRELPAIRPLESDADAVLTRLCGCDKLLQSLSLELAQLQLDKDTVHSALELSRLQVEEWKNQGPRAHEEALSQKAFLQEELVTIRARMCDVSLEIERVWSQYERMESELSVIRSHLQHICNFGMPQEQSQAQRELWMMEDILAGLKANRDHICFLLGLQRHHVFQSLPPHPGSPGSERLQSGLPMSLQDMEPEPPVRPPLPMELRENHESMDRCHGWTESLYEGIYSYSAEPVHRRGNSQPDLVDVKAQRDSSESQPSSKWVPPNTGKQSSKRMKMKMSEEEQIERMKRNQERLTNKKKPPIPAQGVQSQSSEAKMEAPFPLRVTRVVTAVLPSSLVARRVSVEDPPAELNTPLPEQIPPEMQKSLAEQSKTPLSKPARRLLLETHEQNCSSAEMHRDHPVKKTSRQQHQGGARASRMDSHSEVSRAEGTDASSDQVQDLTGLRHGSQSLDFRAEEQCSAPLTPEMDPDFSLSPEQRDAKLRRVERIRERVMRSAVRESATTDGQQPIKGQRKEAHQVPLDISRKQRKKEELQLSSATYENNEEGCQRVKKSISQDRSGYRTQHSGRPGVAKTKIKHQASPYHISSMTVYQEEGGRGFTGGNDDEQKQREKHAASDSENNLKSSDLKAKWFLSTNQWQGFLPLQIPTLETLLNEKKEDTDDQPTCSDDNSDSNGLSSTVSESLEKMKENHSLFYKIACDISISDSDITKNDAQTSSKPDDENVLMITESLPVEDTSIPSGQEDKDSSKSLSTEENSLQSDKRHKDVTVETQSNEMLKISESPTCVQEDITSKECEDNSRGSGEHLNDTETGIRASLGDIKSDQTLEDCASTKEEHTGAKKSEDQKVDQERSEELKKCLNLTKVKNENEQEQDNKQSIGLSNSAYEGGGVIRSASFGKPRVTVIRTSL